MSRKTHQLVQPKKVAVFSEIIEEPALPLPFVHYPSHYGVFLGFGQDEQDPPKLCLCCKGAFEVARKCIDSNKDRKFSDALLSAPLSSRFFPESLAKISINKSFHVEFYERLCHRCNLVPPTQSYCHPMYGGLFKQTYGWYINQTRLRFGAVSNLEVIVQDQCPLEVLELIKTYCDLLAQRNSIVIAWEKEHSRIEPLPLTDGMLHLDKIISKLKRKIDNFWEDETRQEFGFRKIGDAWIGESVLAQIVFKIFSEVEVLRHHRPSWLDGLELDVFVPSKSLGFEYQGQQHYFAIKAWGGKKSLVANQARDEKKRLLCKKTGIRLIEIHFSEPLTLEHISHRIFGLPSC